MDGGGPGIDVNAVVPRVHILTAPHAAHFGVKTLLWAKFFELTGFSHSPGSQIQKKAPQGVLSFVWRWARDSNPGNLSVQRFSRPPLSTTQPAHLNLSRLPSREAPHYSDASLTIKLPVRYFPRNLYPLQLPLLEGLAGRLLPAQGCSRFSQRLGTRPS